MKERIVVGVSGASGAPIAVELLCALRNFSNLETHLIVTDGGWRTIAEETQLTPEQFGKLADVVNDCKDTGAPPASGSWRTLGMIVAPCSMKTLAGIHSGYSDNLLLRAADVTIKEGRKLVLMPRECPMSPIHLRNQYELSMMGVVMVPPVLSYYNHPEDLTDAARHLVGKVMDQFGLQMDGFRRWGE